MIKKSLIRKVLFCAIVLIISFNLFLLENNNVQSLTLVEMNKVAYASQEEIIIPPDIEEPFSVIEWVKDILNIEN